MRTYMRRPERRERERKAAARTCHSLDAFFSPKKRKTGMYFKFVTFQKVTGPTPNHLLWYQHTPDLHPGIAKAGGGAGDFSFFRKAHFLIKKIWREYLQ